jgi:hypothetical protein
VKAFVTKDQLALTKEILYTWKKKEVRITNDRKNETSKHQTPKAKMKFGLSFRS